MFIPNKEGKGNPLRYSCLENFTDRGAWCATVHGVTKSQTQLSMHTKKKVKKYTEKCLYLNNAILCLKYLCNSRFFYTVRLNQNDAIYLEKCGHISD